MKRPNPVIVTTPAKKTIVYTWQTPTILVLAVGGTVFAVVALYYLLTSGLTALGLLLAIILSIYGYFMSAFALNKTTIEADESRLSVSHGPVPWTGNRTISLPELASLYCERIDYGKHTTYSVRAILRNGEGITLLTLGDESLAKSIVDELE
jgi:hypothetical protein